MIMQQNIQTLLAPLGLEANAFPPESRYHGVGITQIQEGQSPPVVYLQRRFIPQQETFATLQTHLIEAHDRIDNLANTYLGTPQLYWRICDANGVIQPNEVTETVGSRVRITLPAGFPGNGSDEGE